jgi:hypothetical protein
VANWKPFAIQLPGKDFLSGARSGLETLVIFMEVVKAILDTIKVFLIDFGNPIKPIVEALLKLILDLIEALKKSGIFAYYDIPNPLSDSKFAKNSGGYQGFSKRFKQSLLDVQDLNRPQPSSGSTTGGYVLIVVDAQAPMQLISLVSSLLKFFGRETLNPSFPPPANVRVVPVGESGDPLLQVTKLFKEQVKTLAVEWSLASTMPAADSGFEGVATQIIQEFYPPKWLIERAEMPLNAEITEDDLSKPAAAGYLTKIVEIRSKDRKTNKPLKQKIRIKDSYGEPFIKFNAYAVVSGASNPATFFTGLLGTYRFLDTNVEVDKTYFYRVRAYNGIFAFENAPVGQLVFSKSDIQQNQNDGDSYFFQWPAKNKADGVVVGKPSGIVQAKIPKVPENFDLPENIRRLFLTAFSLNFHLPLPPPAPVTDSTGKPTFDSKGNPITKPLFDSLGNPAEPLMDSVTDIGRGSIASLAGTLASLQALPVIGLVGTVGVPSNQSAIAPDLATGKPPQMPWQIKTVRFQSARLMVKYTSFFSSGNASMAEGFKRLMQGSLPKGTPSTASKSGSTLAGADTLEKMVAALTKVEVKQDSIEAIATAIAETTGTNDGVVDEATMRTYGSAFEDPIVRKNILAGIEYLLTLAGQGEAPNWVSISILRDIIPWSGQLLDDLAQKIRGLADSYKGVMGEITTFIDTITRKIDTLERFLKYLVSILNYIESLSVGFYFLDSGTLSGDVSEWMSTLDNATGSKPPSGPGGYTAGISFAYLGPDVASIVSAFGLIF